ncbi:hypothetical protein TARUN_10238, partial [Trichoderma arundinaceum]
SAYQYASYTPTQSPNLPSLTQQSPISQGYVISHAAVNSPPQQQAQYTASSPPPVPYSTRPPVQGISANYRSPLPPAAPAVAEQQLPASQNGHSSPSSLSGAQSHLHQHLPRPTAANDYQPTVPAVERTPLDADKQSLNRESRIPSQTPQPQPAQVTSLQTPNNSMPLPPPQAGVQQSDAATPHDPLAHLSTQMDHLHMSPPDRNPVTQPSVTMSDDNAPRPPPQIRATGLPLEIITYCPESRAVDYSLYWYRLPDVPDFLICTKCHADHIQPTQLASEFEKIKRPDDIFSSCSFWFPRVKEVTWPQVVRTGDLSALRSFMKKRHDVKACKGRDLTPASEGIKWFGMSNNDINGFISCEACYEDRIADTSFEDKFSLYREQPTNEKWSCDLAVPYVSRAIVKMAKRNDWAGFVDGATRRLSLAKCEGQEIQSNACKWYLPRRKIENMRACEACYMDRVAFTRFEDEFEAYIMAEGFDSYFHHMTQLWSCKLTETNLPLLWAMENAIEQRNWSVFSSSAEVACRLPRCTKYGFIRGKWWTIKGGCDNFDVCETCYMSILRTSGVGQFFEPAQRDPEATLVCDFCVSSPRFRQYLRHYAKSIDQGVFSYYLDYVATFASVPVCPGLNTAEKTNWWGYPGALFCQDCYLSFVADTKLGSFVPIKEGYDERAQICQIWSPRMRTMWLQACDAGAPGSPESNAKVEEFTEFANKRIKVYTQTVPQINFIRQMKQLKMESAMHQGLLSVMYNGMDGFASVAGTTDGNLHGNSQLGWYATEQGAQGAQMFNNMQDGFASANRTDEWMQIFQLQMIWKEVE